MPRAFASHDVIVVTSCASMAPKKKAPKAKATARKVVGKKAAASKATSKQKKDMVCVVFW